MATVSYLASAFTPRLFMLGRIMATPGALRMLNEAGKDPVSFIRRHVAGDFGDLDEEDKQANLNAVRHGGRVFSSYVVTGGAGDTEGKPSKLWIITESDRSCSTLLLPEEY